MAAAGSANLHTVFTSECNNKQFDWFTVGVYESFRTSGMQGSITRLLACSEEDLKRYKGLGLGPTFVHPNYRHNPLNNDTSASYNKPASVMHFSQEANFTEEFILFIDADMLITRPIDPVALGAKKGVVVSEQVPYMIGTHNGMAEQFLAPEAVPRAKPVGWYHIFHREDLKRIAPLWLKYCGRVRLEPQRYWNMNGSLPHGNIPTGDAYVQFGHAPWISEMYGYAFGAAEAGVDHVITHGIVRYPGEISAFDQEPYILHYGIDFTLAQDYNWNKMSYQKLDLFSCQGRFFGPPPAGRGTAAHKAGRFVVNTLNRAFCGFYHEHCAGTPAATRRCPPTTRPAEVPCTAAEVADGTCCRDSQATCWQWAIDEQCELNKGFMEQTCRLSCGVCTAAESPAAAIADADAAGGALTKLKTKLDQHLGVATETESLPGAHADAWEDPTDPSQKRSVKPSSVATSSVQSAGRSASGGGAAGGGGRAGEHGEEIREEFRRVIEHHRGLYAPGKVPKWLEDQAAGVGAVDGAAYGAHEDSREDAKFAGHRHGAASIEDRLETTSRHPTARWLIYGILGMWCTVIAIAGVFCLRRVRFGSAPPRRTKSRFA